MSEETLQKIETLLAHQERQINDLSEIVIGQGKEIDLLKARLKRMTDKVGKLESAVPDSRDGLSVSEQAALDKPPHY